MSTFSISNNIDGSTSITIKYYAKVSQQLIDDVLIDNIRAAISEAVHKDEDIRKRIEEAVKVAFLTIPIETITSAVRNAVKEEFEAKKEPTF